MLSVNAQQRGSSLIISLVILTAITIGAVVAMQRSTLQVRMVGNMQHQQNVFNAAQNDLSSLIDQLRNSNNAKKLLNISIQADNQNLDPSTTVTIEPFAQGSLVKPPLTHKKNIKPTVNQLRLVSVEDSLKANEGSSSAARRTYYFANRVEANDKNDNVKSIQEIGFYYLAPSPTQ